MKTLTVAVACLLMACLGAWARADEIHLYNGKPRLDVTILDETYEEVTFRMPSIRQQQTVRADQVKEVIHNTGLPEKYVLGLEKMAEGDWSMAANLFLSEAGQDKKSKAWLKQYALYNAAECYRAERQFDEAIKGYDRLLAELPKTKFYGDCYLKKALCYSAKGDDARARSTLESLRGEVQAKGLPQRFGVLGEFHLVRMDEQKDPQKAFEAYVDLQKRAAGMEVTDVANMCRLRIGRVLIHQGKIDDARSYFQDIIDDRQASDVLTVAGAYNGLGRTYVAAESPSKEQWKQAMYAYLRVVFHYGEQLEALGDQTALPEALYWSARCFETRTEDPDTNVKRARVLYTRVMQEYPSSEWAQKAAERN